MTRPRAAWLAFMLLGILDTVLLLEFPIAGVLLLVLAVAGVAARPPRAASIAGLITGIGGTWTGLMVRVKMSCDAFDATPGQGCEAPGIEAWILVGLLILGVGLVTTAAVAIQGTRRG